ncbi:hypothetical protein IST4116A_01194 [Burkholderia cenocepacia]|uniref:hypothetical protein n=1 Tax=Burkholderia cenocepacia TaxID=95486 RepID=UPI0019A643A5|nr:hypothetical protein [Burkholderia cenocepacia]CAB5082821.1 hypothetical protein IST4116B_01186 [Burkholderia cenocepacia]CAB5083500.1 hypothetical protein IST4134_01195 [Burkholderia cenocepacia]CAB5087659.1 hypothetical protein IST4113_01193 [Burkholderia cenocepacia]CAB5095637.1 hypothetical protein IST439_01233 [Burkholderia cenocepacia]CAB5105020.1 hypothetical protein IST4129_01194 [Burkholderia cenocepacia]
MEDSQNTVPSWPFRATGKGQAIAATTASASVTIAAGELLEGALIANLSTSWAWVAFGQGGNATATFPVAGAPGAPQPGMPIAPGTSRSVRPPNAPKDASSQEAVYDTVAVILQTGSGTVLVTPGLGL